MGLGVQWRSGRILEGHRVLAHGNHQEILMILLLYHHKITMFKWFNSGFNGGETIYSG